MNHAEYSEQEIIEASGRGGVSGIGIRTYFGGGYVFDIGRAGHRGFAPSSALEQVGQSLPLLCTHTAMPDWEIGICVPDIKPKSETEEKAFFSATCPIKDEESHEALYHVVYGVTGSILEGNLSTFAQAIRAIQNCRWKHEERSLYGERLIEVEKILYACGADAVGMSSLGPTLYFVGENVAKTLEEATKRLNGCQLWRAKPNNLGREVIDG
jgi:beta-ribofuranosylaminobenzene 5'-phosphate synthase